MDEIRGTRVHITDQTQGDALVDALSREDEELNILDPTIGEMNNPAMYSIRTIDGVLIGVCALYNYTGQQVELGIRVWDRNYWSKGYGTEATILLCAWAFEVKPVECIILKSPYDNKRAIACYKRCGFEEFDASQLDGVYVVWMRKYRPADAGGG